MNSIHQTVGVKTDVVQTALDCDVSWELCARAGASACRLVSEAAGEPQRAVLWVSPFVIQNLDVLQETSEK